MSSSVNNSHILITGGTGLFGGALIEKYLTEETGTALYPLVRASTDEEARLRLLRSMCSSPSFSDRLLQHFHERVNVIAGDFIQASLGIPADRYSGLTGLITDILHSGASVDFGLPLDDARLINVHGTENMLKFAQNCSKLNAFIHISTGHVAGKRSGRIMEDELSTEQGFFNSYEQTKAESELLLNEYMEQLPITIHRLTTVIGDHATGHVRQFGFFHNSVRLLSQGIIPFLAGDKNGHLDLIPTEYPVQAVYHLHRKNFKPGSTYHICSGPERSFTLEAFLNETINYFKNIYTNDSLVTPEIITQDEFKKRIFQTNSARLTAVMNTLDTFIGHLTLPKVFDPTNALHDLEESGIETPNIRSYYFKIMDECARRKFGKK